MVLDVETIQMLHEYVAGDDPAAFGELVEEYITDSSRLLGELDSAYEQKDIPVVQRLAHTLKGQSATFGALDFADICLKIELIARAGALEGIPALTGELERAYRDVKTALRVEVQHLCDTHQIA